MALIGKALAGAGIGLAQAGLMGYRAQVEEARDARLAQYQEQRDERVFGQQSKLQQERFGQEKDIIGQRIEGDKGLIGARAEAEKGVQSAAIRERAAAEEGILTKKQQFEREEADKDRRLRGASLGLQGKELGMREKEFALKERVANIELQNIEQIKALRSEYATATPERKDMIRDEISLLTGKDNDNWVAVPLEIDDMTGKAISYGKMNKKSGEIKPLKDGTLAPIKAAPGERPPLESFLPNTPAKKEPERDKRSSSGLIKRD